MNKEQHKIGKMRHYVTIQYPSVVRDATGAETVTWTQVAQVWASLEPISGREFFNVQQFATETTHRIVIHYRKVFRTFWRIVYGERIFEVQSIINQDERDRYLEIMCKEQVQ